MRRLALATLALVTIGSGLATVPAHAVFPNDPDPWGLVCQFASVSDPTAEAGTQSGQISGGPLVLTDDAVPPAFHPGTLSCTIQVNVANHTGIGGTGVSGHGDAVIVIAPSVINYQAAASDFVYLCSAFTDDATGTTYYFDSDNSVWSTDPTVPCGLASSPGGGGGDDPLRPYEELLDSIICPVLAVVFPPFGDIPGVWDCPPYGV